MNIEKASRPAIYTAVLILFSMPKLSPNSSIVLCVLSKYPYRNSVKNRSRAKEDSLTYACTCTHTHTRAHTHAHTCTRTRTHTHTHTHTHTAAGSPSDCCQQGGVQPWTGEGLPCGHQQWSRWRARSVSPPPPCAGWQTNDLASWLKWKHKHWTCSFLDRHFEFCLEPINDLFC